MHVLIVGTRGAGKRELLQRIASELALPLFGFETRKEDALADAENGSPIYIYDAGSEHCRSEENLVGYCKNQHFTEIKEAFDRYSRRLEAPVPKGHLIYMDELGFMEASSEAFCGAVMRLLDGDIPVLAAVKDKAFPFLDSVRAHSNAKCFYLKDDNSDEIFEEAIEYLRAQLKPE